MCYAYMHIYIQRPSVSDDTIFSRDFQVVGRLGKGGYGVVFRVEKNFDGGEYAVKIIKLLPRR